MRYKTLTEQKQCYIQYQKEYLLREQQRIYKQRNDALKAKLRKNDDESKFLTKLINCIKDTSDNAIKIKQIHSLVEGKVDIFKCLMKKESSGSVSKIMDAVDAIAEECGGVELSVEFEKEVSKHCGISALLNDWD
ncbi:hypothetical protein ACA350_11270 [Orientia tsutsugamushi]|uniref:hypothetical protein n=1 Tax=Orientia tsutsugamushi TaxID=784 RepID=UPI003528971D